eukprot:NODE_1046_length_1689_cov_44.218950_g982_i0.p1 GENE.NODE_1046_length_1689_cov_44.218950_g982_i0~~NODE_1046_length_1689_cov_44.218950_g982_i0.p1  ORF type:complete len:553 (+),score=161.75 NODE_1046_length_1689_cov_44.218950_g982_i0:234-1661(+)
MTWLANLLCSAGVDTTLFGELYGLITNLLENNTALGPAFTALQLPMELISVILAKYKLLLSFASLGSDEPCRPSLMKHVHQLYAPEYFDGDSITGRNFIQRCIVDEQVTGQLAMGLQSLRESPHTELTQLVRLWWSVYESVYTKILCEMCGELEQCSRSDQQADSVELWLDMNKYCDDQMVCFVDEFKADCLTDYYTTAGTWCQGNANLACAILVGIDQWELVRDYMNHQTNIFKADPIGFSEQHTASDLQDCVEILKAYTDGPIVMYLELDAWCHNTATDTAGMKSNGGHVFLVQRVGTDIETCSYFILSSWRGKYSLSKWFKDHPECLQLSYTAMEQWLTDFSTLIGFSNWGVHPQQMFHKLFGLSDCTPTEEWEINNHVEAGLVWELHFYCADYFEEDVEANMSSVMSLAAQSKHNVDLMLESMALSALQDLDVLQMRLVACKSFGKRCTYLLGTDTEIDRDSSEDDSEEAP